VSAIFCWASELDANKPIASVRHIAILSESRREKFARQGEAFVCGMSISLSRTKGI
jgi:hypothetical protein